MKIVLPETTSASFGPQVTKPQVIANFRFRRIAKLKFKQFSQNVETFHCLPLSAVIFNLRLR